MTTSQPSTLRFRTGQRAGLVTRETEGGPDALLLGLHGRGSFPERIEGWSPPRPLGARHVLPRGPFEGAEGAAWYLGRPAPEAELARSTAAALQVLETLWAQGHTPGRTLVWGFSQGALLALQVALSVEVPLAGVFAVAPRLHPSAERLLGRPGVQSRFFMIHGRADETIRFSVGEDARDALRRAGAEVTWVEHDEAHVFNAGAVADLEQFAARVLDS